MTRVSGKSTGTGTESDGDRVKVIDCNGKPNFVIFMKKAIMIRPLLGPRSGQGWAIHVMMGDNGGGWFAKPYESGRPWILMMHSGR